MAKEMKEKKVKTGFAGRMVAAIWGAVAGAWWAFSYIVAEGFAGPIGIGLVVTAVLFIGLIVLAVLSKKNSLCAKLYVIVTSVNMVVMFVTGAWGYYGILAVIVIALCAYIGGARGIKYLKNQTTAVEE